MSDLNKRDLDNYITGHGGEDYFEGDDPVCERCGGDGYILICVDDLCHGSGEEPGYRCIHGDGDIICPKCKGKGSRFEP